MSTAHLDDWLTRRAASPRAAARSAATFDLLAERAAGIGVALLIVTGFVSSYTTLRDLAVAAGHFPLWLAPVVPLSFDVGIVVLSLKVLLAARAGRTAPVLRALVLVLSVATVLANGAMSVDPVGQLLHAVPSAMFVVCFETIVTAARREALHQRRTAVVDGRFRIARWVLAPRLTWSEWRAEVLTEWPAAGRGASPSPTTVPFEPVSVAVPAVRSLVPSVAVSRVPSRGDGQRPDRLAVAMAIVRDQPDVTAATLADTLLAAGFPVSVRTAQRIRGDARELLAATTDGPVP
ncbi:DUF2637 domain-containing protein [Kineococcus sp. R8]|uniref:DUF2637 domain-containing protein n=1 Tax=Kineococcus siccus TaxID=2696567 RepID=UPI00141272FE|nr:DUF2637 domain-containing protein [Kineococcus siccus]